MFMRPFAREELAVPGVSGRHHAVEHVDAAGHAFDEVDRACRRPLDSAAGRPAAAGPCRLDHLIHHLVRLADAQAADRVALEPDRDSQFRALGAQLRKRPALHDAELRLAGMGSGPSFRDARKTASRHAARPARRQLQRLRRSPLPSRAAPGTRRAPSRCPSRDSPGCPPRVRASADASCRRDATGIRRRSRRSCGARRG